MKDVKVINVAKKLKTRVKSGLHNHTAYIKGKEIIIFDWVSRVDDKVVNDSRLRNKHINEFGYDVDDENIVNMLVGVETKTKMPIMFSINEIDNFNVENETVEYV